jgi:hypothetical protein
MKEKWIAAIGRVQWNPNSRSVVCERHFSESDLCEDKKMTNVIYDFLVIR